MVEVSKISCPSLYQNVIEGKFIFIDERENSEEDRNIEPIHFQPGLYSSAFDKVLTMNDKL